MSRRSNPPGRRRDRPSSRAARAQRPAGRRGRPRTDPRLLAGALALGAILLLSGFVLAGGLGGGSPVPTVGPGGSTAAGSCPTSQPAALGATDTRTVTITTAKGTIVIKVTGSLSPIAAGNFVALADCGFYDGVTFHRLVPGFVIQGGDPAGNGSGGPGYTIADEPVTATYHRGTVAMARTTNPHSEGSQFFIVLSDNAASALTQTQQGRGYAIFGEVTSGMDVVDAIAAMPNSGSPNNTALQPVALDAVTVANP
jgi:cyclophilin family peptidyl-prolyl cis-trans isomerase